MIRCPICHRALSPSGGHPYAPICSEACRKEAMRRAGLSEPVGFPPESGEGPQEQFKQLTATHLYCSTCRRSMPTREKLLLILPNGQLYGYSCVRCGSDVGTRTENRS